MALPVFTFCPEFGAREVRAPRTSPFKFGNGNERRYRFGLVTDLRTWELSFDYNTDVRREEILAFLEERGAWKAFEWTDPKGYFARWRCKTWQTIWNGPRQSLVTCTFVELDERVATFVPPSGPAGIPDMWLSRVTTPVVGCRDSVNILTSDGGSYQTALIQEEGVIGERDLYVFRRNAAGVIIWQGEFQAFHTVFSISAAGPQPPVLVVDKDDNLYVVYGQSGFFGEGSAGNDERIFVFKVNANGTLGWQHKYRRSRPGSSLTGLLLCDAIYNPILDVVVVVARGTTSGSDNSSNEINILNLAPASGAVVNQRTLNSLLVTNSGSVRAADSALAQTRSNRLFISANSGFTTAIAELSLDLGTLFSTPRLTPVDATYSFPASDGGWYSVCSIQKGSSSILRILKLTSSFAPVWLQSNSGGNIPMGASAPFNLSQRSIGQNGKIAWCYRSGDRVDFGAAGLIGSYLSTALFDHENSLAGERATTLGSGEHITVGAGLSLIRDSVRSRVTTSSARNTGTNGMKVFAVGARDFYEDGAARYLDAGISEVSTFFTTVRSQIDGTYGQLQFADILDLPLASAASPETRADVNIIREDGLDRVFQNGSLGIAYYTYSDPEYVAPTQEGAASLVFYGGNNAVQRVSVDKTFAPALLVIANRAASNRKAVFNTFFSKRHYQGWNGTRSTIASTSTTEVDGLVELAQGNFKVAGRLDSLNKAGENFVAFALGATTGAHEIVSYTGTGAIRAISHSLGATPSFVLFQGDNSTITLAGTALGGTGLNRNAGNSTGTVTTSTSFIRAIGSSSIEVGTSLSVNDEQYRMHVFQSSDDWTIGNASGPGSSTLTVSLGFQPRAILFKGATGVGTAWQLLYRVDSTPGLAKSLPLNAGSAVEADSAMSITADGFTIPDGAAGNTGSSSAFYFAIR